MVRPWVHIHVRDVRASSQWYRSLLECGGMDEHPHRQAFDQLADADGTVLLGLVSWANHELPWSPEEGPVGNGLTLDFVVTDFDEAWKRALSLEAIVEQEPELGTTGFQTRSFRLRDPDGYCVTILDGTRGWPANVLG